MSNLLEIGSKINTAGQTGDILSVLGEGGQGVVYLARLGSENVAVKWYYVQDDEQRAIIENLVSIGPPSKRFIWPMAIATSPDSPDGTFGYVMPVIPSGYKTIDQLLDGNVPISFRALAHACVLLADSFMRLHAKGLCYKDISYGNVSLNEQGDILVIDNDNVTVRNEKVKVAGTMRFMAPEIVLGDGKPNESTDLFSLGVLLFYMLYIHHPLEGEVEAGIICFNEAAMEKIYGKEPIYIFDRNNTTNRPVPGLPGQQNAIDYHKIYPQFLKDLFHEHFTHGMKNPQRRIGNSQWRRELVKLRDSIFLCKKCRKAQVFYERSVLVNTGKLATCWQCSKIPNTPPRMKLPGGEILILDVGTKLYMNHLDETQSDYETVIGEVSSNPANRLDVGVTNKMSVDWQLTYSDGTRKSLAPGKTIRLQDRMQINIEGRDFVVRTS